MGRARPAVIAVVGGKGGCGKTTTTLGVARALVDRGQTPLVIDADADMPDLCRLAGAEERGGTDGLAAGAPVREAAVRPPAFPGIRLVTAGGRRRLPEALAAAAAYRGPTLIDTPAGASPGVARPLGRADRALLVTTTTPACLEDARSTHTLARRLDTPLAGTLVREGFRDSDRQSSVPGRDPRSGPESDRIPGRVLARVPTVAAPFESSAVRAGWQAVAAALASGRGA